MIVGFPVFFGGVGGRRGRVDVFGSSGDVGGRELKFMVLVGGFSIQAGYRLFVLRNMVVLEIRGLPSKKDLQRDPNLESCPCFVDDVFLALQAFRVFCQGIAGEY